MVQGTRIGQWIRLASEPKRPALAEVPDDGTSATEAFAMEMIVHFPGDLKTVYRNAQGEIYLRLTSTVDVTAIGDHSAHEVELEQAYWVTPETEKWVLREGM